MEFSCSTSLISRMLEASSNSLIALYFLTIIIQLINAQNRSPSCLYFKENSGSISNEYSLSPFVNNSNNHCTVLKESDYCLSFSEFMNLEMNISEVEETYISTNNTKYAYVNVTVDYNWGPQSNRFLLQESEVGTCWNIQILGDEYPSHVIVSNIPVSLNFSGLTAATVLSESHGPPSCKKSCLSLNGLVLNFAAYENKKSVILKVHVEEDSEYRLELLSGKCNISCNGETNQCKVKIWNEILHLNAREGQELSFFNLTPAFYCARIGTLDNCCVIHTATEWLNDVSEINVIVVVDPLAHYVIAAVVVGIILTSSFVFFVTRTLFCPWVFRRKKTSNEPEKEYDVSLITETDLQQLIDEIKDSVQVYLVYNYDSDEFLDLMASFRQLLSCFVKKVWDPYSDEDFEDVSSNSSKWVQTVLINPNIRIILVETEEAVAREKMWIEGQEEQPSEFQHCLHNVFLFTLSHMINDFQKFFDYTRTFIIRIEPSIKSNFTFQSCTRYNLPDNLEKLIFDLSRHITKRRNIDFQDFSKFTLWLKEKEEFINEQMKFNQAKQKITREYL